MTGVWVSLTVPPVYVLSEYEGLTLRMLVECYSPTVAPVLHPNGEPFELFMKLLECTNLAAANIPPPQDLALKQVCVHVCVCMCMCG